MKVNYARILSLVEEEGLGDVFDQDLVGIMDDSTATNGQKKTRKELRKEGKDYRPPTADEIRQLQETQSLYKSNLFRLQVIQTNTFTKDNRITFRSESELYQNNCC